MVNLDDTIVAEATPPGRGGIAVVRLSGPLALDILDKLFSPATGDPPAKRPRVAVYGQLKGARGRAIDRCIALAFPAPDSFTGEDVAEVHLHGSPGIVREAIRTCSEAGARPALPGEFSYRAFIRGKTGLLDAEAVNALSRCETREQTSRLDPEAVSCFSRAVASLGERLEELHARLEAELDFPEEVSELSFPRIPPRDPVTRYAEAETVWMYLLTHG